MMIRSATWKIWLQSKGGLTQIQLNWEPHRKLQAPLKLWIRQNSSMQGKIWFEGRMMACMKLRGPWRKLEKKARLVIAGCDCFGWSKFKSKIYITVSKLA